ncbi:MAG: hypothetical protein ACI4HQ_06490 [Acetatifactor sp.]
MKNGFSSIFMVSSVTAVPPTDREKRDHGSSRNSKKDFGEGLFAQILRDTAKKTESKNLDCHTTTYGRDSKMRSFIYEGREYRY